MLTLIDLAGLEGDNCIGRESVDNSMVQGDTSNMTDKLNYTKMSDCGRLAKKVKVLGDIVEKSLCSSLRAFKAYVLSLPSDDQKPPPHKLKKNDPEATPTLIELFSQNIKTDYRIYIMGHIDATSNSPETAAQAAETLAFCNSFKNIVGERLAAQEDKRTKGDTQSPAGSNLESMLKELRQEEDKVDLTKGNDQDEVVAATPPEIAAPEIKRRKAPEEPWGVRPPPIPEDLVNKLSELAGGPSGPPSARGEAGDKIQASVSKINPPSDREKAPDTCMSGVLQPEERVLFTNIKKNANELNKELLLAATTPIHVERAEQYNRLMKVIHTNQRPPSGHRTVLSVKVRQPLNATATRPRLPLDEAEEQEQEEDKHVPAFVVDLPRSGSKRVGNVGANLNNLC